MLILHQIRATSRPISQAWAKCKNELLHVSVSNQNIETSCKNKLKSSKLKDCVSKKDECT